MKGLIEQKWLQLKTAQSATASFFIKHNSVLHLMVVSPESLVLKERESHFLWMPLTTMNIEHLHNDIPGCTKMNLRTFTWSDQKIFKNEVELGRLTSNPFLSLLSVTFQRLIRLPFLMQDLKHSKKLSLIAFHSVRLRQHELSILQHYDKHQVVVGGLVKMQ